jgi:hypothetical protein
VKPPIARSAPSGAVRPHGVVVEPPFGQGRPGMGERAEQGLSLTLPRNGVGVTQAGHLHGTHRAAPIWEPRWLMP